MSIFSGSALTLELYGSSHGEEIGMKLSGLPAGFSPDPEDLSRFLSRRSTGHFTGSTARREPDAPEFLTGLCGGSTDGRIIHARILNRDAQSRDYQAEIPRPGHADYTSYLKYGRIFPGGGPFSGRMTAPLCIAGGLAVQYLRRYGIAFFSHVASIGTVKDDDFDPLAPTACPDDGFPVLNPEAGAEMQRVILAAQSVGDSVGGCVECAVTGIPAGIGGELFDGLESKIALLVFAIPAVKGIEFGNGFSATGLNGSENNDAFCLKDGVIRTETNRCGGILGGISTGQPLVFRCAFKPTPSISIPQKSVSLLTGTETMLSTKGRHDACIVPRALPCVEAAAALALLDVILSSEEHCHDA